MSQNLALGIDIGGTKTAFGIVNRSGEIIMSGEIPTVGYSSLVDYIANLKAAIDPLVENVGRINVQGCGVGAPNANVYTGEIAYAANLPWPGIVPLSDLLGEALGMQVRVTNDANAAAIGEMTYGVAKGMNDFFIVTLGTGVGSGFVANGKLIYGHDGFAGELGHTIAKRGGRTCGCGRRGCLETYASATGIARSAEEWLVMRDDITLLREKQGRIVSKDIYDAAVQGDAFALELFDYTGTTLGRVLADMVAILSPEAIVFFGGLARAGDLILGPTKKHMENNLLKVFKNKVKFLSSSFKESDAAVLGASALVW